MYTSLLDKRATIQRVTTTNDGPEPSAVWASVATGVPCRVSYRSGQEMGPMFDADVSEVRLFFGYGVDLRNSDRVVVDSVTYQVEPVNQDPGGRQHHVEALARVVA